MIAAWACRNRGECENRNHLSEFRGLNLVSQFQRKQADEYNTAALSLSYSSPTYTIIHSRISATYLYYL